MERFIEVGQQVKARRTELGLNQDSIDGVSSSWLRRLEKGEIRNPRSSTLRALERSLEWPVGTVDQLSEGLLDAEEISRLVGSGRTASPADGGVGDVFSSLREARLQLGASDAAEIDPVDLVSLRAQALDLRDQIDEFLAQPGEGQSIE